MSTNGSNSWRELDDKFSRNKHPRNDWFGRSLEEDHARYEGDRGRYEEARRRYNEAHVSYVASERPGNSQDVSPNDGGDRRHRFADTDDDTNNNWRAWSGRSFAYDERHRDPNLPHRHRLAHDEFSRYAAGYEEQYGHPSLRGHIDYDRQWASNTEPTDEREGDPDPTFIPRDEYGRRR